MLLKDLAIGAEAFVGNAFIEATALVKTTLEISLKQGARACYRLVKTSEKYVTIYLKESESLTYGMFVPIPVRTDETPTFNIKRKQG